MKRTIAALAATLSTAPAAFAQEAPSTPQWIYGSLGYSFQGAEGTEFALGFQTDWNRTFYVRFSPLNLVLTDIDGFYRDSFSNGQSRCRNESNGQFATDGSCTGLDYRVDADAYIRLGGNFLIGGGVLHTVSSEYTPEREGQTDSFAAIMFEGGEHWGIELRGGKDNAALRLRGSF